LKKHDLSHIETIANNYNVDLKHAVQISKICEELFLQSRFLHKQPKNLVPLLCSAAILHEVGLSVDKKSFQKHSQAIILNEELPFMLKKEKLILANLVRYHRKKTPQLSHPQFAKLSKIDQETVILLSAVLRFALGFDKKRLQSVKKIKVFAIQKELIVSFHSSSPNANEEFDISKSAHVFCQVLKKNMKIIKI
jgi:exopolyphosphatase / guanosine-5'-triphosphate,3'-diphosphate pyrophosphatase